MLFTDKRRRVTVHNCGRHLEFRKRSFMNKIQRVIYKLYRGIYVGVIFYFVPFTLVFTYRLIPSERLEIGGEE